MLVGKGEKRGGGGGKDGRLLRGPGKGALEAGGDVRLARVAQFLKVKEKSSGFGAKLFDMLTKVHVRGFEHCDD